MLLSGHLQIAYRLHRRSCRCWQRIFLTARHRASIRRDVLDHSLRTLAIHTFGIDGNDIVLSCENALHDVAVVARTETGGDVSASRRQAGHIAIAALPRRGFVNLRVAWWCGGVCP